MGKIDVVVTWVDGTDYKWLEEKSNYKPKGKYEEANTQNRFTPSELFRYWFRGIEKNAPWVNKIFFITYGHIPEWLNVNHPKLRIVKHEEYIPSQYLPTYNSNVIELNVHRIEDLSEKFILFNDDMYLIDRVKETDFFVGEKVRDLAIYKPIIPFGSFSHIEVNNTIIMNKYFKKRRELKRHPFKFFRLKNGKYNINNLVALLYPGILGYMGGHVAYPHLKSTFIEVYKKIGNILPEVEKSRFRSEDDVSHYLMSHWNIETGKFVPRNVNFGRYFENNEVKDIISALKTKKYKVICINDTMALDSEETDRSLEEIFSKIFPKKSKFEI